MNWHPFFPHFLFRPLMKTEAENGGGQGNTPFHSIPCLVSHTRGLMSSTSTTHLPQKKKKKKKKKKFFFEDYILREYLT